MTGLYASKTKVSSERSRLEIERVMIRYGADQFAFGHEPRGAMIGFRMKSRLLRFHLPLPAKVDFLKSERGRARSVDAAEAAWEQACRQAWRALALAIKAKLEAVASGITSFEEEFLAHIVLPDGLTVGEHVVPKIEESYKSGRQLNLLPPPPKPKE